jgi:hypothetical protein
MPTTCGSVALTKAKAKANAKIIDVLIAAGMIVIGKANMSVGTPTLSTIRCDVDRIRNWVTKKGLESWQGGLLLAARSVDFLDGRQWILTVWPRHKLPTWKEALYPTRPG